MREIIRTLSKYKDVEIIAGAVCVNRYYSQFGDNEHKPEACFKAYVHYHPTMEAGQNT